MFCYLDEVSLGSTFTDVRTLLRNVPAAGLPGDQFTIQLEYGNQSAILAEDSRLTLTLPVGLDLISASLPPARDGADLVWELGDLPPASGLQSISLTLAMNDAAAHGEMLIPPGGDHNPIRRGGDKQQLRQRGNFCRGEDQFAGGVQVRSPINPAARRPISTAKLVPRSQG